MPVKVGMVLTAHKTVTMFMPYVHTEDYPIRAAAETVAARRRSVVAGLSKAEPPAEEGAALPEAQSITIASSQPATPRVPARPGATKTAIGNYRPYRGRRNESRPAPPKPVARPALSEEMQHG